MCLKVQSVFAVDFLALDYVFIEGHLEVCNPFLGVLLICGNFIGGIREGDGG